MTYIRPSGPFFLFFDIFFWYAWTGVLECEFQMPITKAYNGVFFSAALKTFYFFLDRILVSFDCLDSRVHEWSDLPANRLFYEAKHNGITLLARLTLGTSCMISYSGYVQ